ncbi:MAG: hypothetical protein ACLQMO_17075 [Acidobacteriaceae bacterium]
MEAILLIPDSIPEPSRIVVCFLIYNKQQDCCEFHPRDGNDILITQVPANDFRLEVLS